MASEDVGVGAVVVAEEETAEKKGLKAPAAAEKGRRGSTKWWRPNGG